MEGRFILCSVVQYWEHYLQDILEHVPFMGDEQNSNTTSLDLKRSFEVHGLVLELLLWGGRLDLCPLSHEVRQDLRLDGGLRDEADVVRGQFYGPLHDSSDGISIVEDIAYEVAGHNNDLMRLKVMFQLSGGDQECI